MRISFQHWPQLKDVCRILDTASDLGVGHAGYLEGGGDVIKHSHVRIIDKELVNKADVAFLRADARYIPAIHQDLACRAGVKSRHEFDERCFASPCLAKQDVEMPGLENEVGVFNMNLSTDFLGNVF